MTPVCDTFWAGIVAVCAFCFVLPFHAHPEHIKPWVAMRLLDLKWVVLLTRSVSQRVSFTVDADAHVMRCVARPHFAALCCHSCLPFPILQCPSRGAAASARPGTPAQARSRWVDAHACSAEYERSQQGASGARPTRNTRSLTLVLLRCFLTAVFSVVMSSARSRWMR